MVAQSLNPVGRCVDMFLVLWDSVETFCAAQGGQRSGHVQLQSCSVFSA